jgi:hypothetical protein
VVILLGLEARFSICFAWERQFAVTDAELFCIGGFLVMLAAQRRRPRRRTPYVSFKYALARGRFLLLILCD